MKKIITVVAFITCITVLAQSRQETETWLLSKLNLYTTKEYKGNYSYTESNRNFSFDGTYFTYSYNYYNGKSGTITYKIPIWAIENVTLTRDSNYSSYSTLQFTLENYCKSCYFENKWQEQKRKLVTYYKEPMFPGQKKIQKTKYVNDGFIHKSNSSSAVKSFEIKSFAFDPEENFMARFNKAIKHLKTLYPKKPQKTETF